MHAVAVVVLVRWVTQLGCSHGPSKLGRSVVKLRLRWRLKFGLMSGWLPSMPVSILPTMTPDLPW